MSPQLSSKVYQDEIYLSKGLSPLAVAIIDTAEFQRLHGLKQLGFAYFAYRGATHTRFSHSVGTYFAARTLLRRIVQNHERLGLKHPGRCLSERLTQIPPDSGINPRDYHGFQGPWRGMSEVVTAAALLHDLGHVPFGHTFEDEFSGLFERHDSLVSPRLHTMLFHPSSELSSVFSDNGRNRWLSGLSNEELRRLIFVILSYKEKVCDSSYAPFLELLDKAGGNNHSGINELKKSYLEFTSQRLFHPFMSDVIANTICADILDYLVRDQTNLGVECRAQNRIQRYFFIRNGTLKDDEGLRLTIMVCRPDKGGQRRDVATTVFDIMRERYEMAERVFYHHKKAAASTMIAKLLDISPAQPRDNDKIYPAPWTTSISKPERAGKDPDMPSLAETAHAELSPHLTHLSDDEIIDYLGISKVRRDGHQMIADKYVELRRKLWLGLRYRKLYRTLLVVDRDLAGKAPHGPEHLSEELWGEADDQLRIEKARKNRNSLEAKLVDAAASSDSRAQEGDVLIYCPSGKMQSKEIDVRVELEPEKVLPLRRSAEFVLQEDIEILRRYYKELWRMYIFVEPDLYHNDEACFSIIKTFAELYKLPLDVAIKKSRKPDELKRLLQIPDLAVAVEAGQRFLPNMPMQSGVPLAARTTGPGLQVVDGEPETLPPPSPISDEEVFCGVMREWGIGSSAVERLKVLVDFAGKGGLLPFTKQADFLRFLRRTIETHSYPKKWVWSARNLDEWFAEFHQLQEGDTAVGSKL